MTDTHNETQTVTEKAKAMADDAAASISETAGYAADEGKSMLLRAQQAIGQAVQTTVDSFKERPLTSAAIAGGVVAAAAGTGYGVKKLFSDSSNGNGDGATAAPKKGKNAAKNKAAQNG
ncbi:MAG: hypothetical protein K2X76_05640 [Sphingomonas sp.]|nr:hypothetical protein [Sphingomonas sp.]